MKIRVTKEFDFEMGHVLHGYDGLCKHIHGHTYRLFVTVIGEPIQDKNNTKQGMVIDFGDLKRIVREEVVLKFDHSLAINETQKEEFISKENSPLYERFHVLSYQPTCENLIGDFAERIRKRLPQGVSLFSLRLHETTTSYAEWYASDNL